MNPNPNPNPKPNPNPNPSPNPNPNPNQDVESSRLNLALLREAGERPPAAAEAVLAGEGPQALATYRQGHSMGGASYYSGGV